MGRQWIFTTDMLKITQKSYLYRTGLSWWHPHFTRHHINNTGLKRKTVQVEFVWYWHLERAFLKRFPLTCLRTWCGCRLRCRRVNLQKSCLLENKHQRVTTFLWGNIFSEDFGRLIGVSLRLFCAGNNVWLILAVVELCRCTQFLILLPLRELLQLC